MPTVAEKVGPLLLEAYRIPSITGYNRLEPAQRTKNFDRSLRAEVRDALWMLTRQWQFGEFEGDDTGSPVTAQIAGQHSKIDRMSFPDKSVIGYDDAIPLETKVERQPMRVNLQLSVQLSRYFYKCILLQGLLTSANKVKLITQYPLLYTVENSNPLLRIDPNDIEGIQLLNAVNGKLPDGFALLSAINTAVGGTTYFAQWLAGAGYTTAEKNNFIQSGTDLAEWYRRTYSQPENPGDSAWLPSQLEYQFAIGTPADSQKGKTLTAEQYSGGHLDWYSFELNSKQQLLRDPESSPDPEAFVEKFVSFIPGPVSFKGMPNPRFWMMEDSQTDFGKIDTTPTGLLHLLLAEFGLIYGNDWFMLPYPLQVNTVCEIKSMVVTDTFGQHIVVQPAGKGPESDWQRWAMFRLTDKYDDTLNKSLFYLAPTVTNMLEGDPVEQVNFLRDEMANMVWAVETVVPSQAGTGVNGNELALKEDTSPPYVPFDAQVAIRYVLGTTVPENWIPFVPVHLPSSVSEIHLQRAQMPHAKGAIGTVLTEVPPPYFINEEEIPRVGVVVKQSFQRARWYGGATWLWLGREKEAAAGEGWSNLKFDQIEDIRRIE